MDDLEGGGRPYKTEGSGPMLARFDPSRREGKRDVIACAPNGEGERSALGEDGRGLENESFDIVLAKPNPSRREGKRDIIACSSERKGGASSQQNCAEVEDTTTSSSVSASSRIGRG